jgi:threonine dehydratase
MKGGRIRQSIPQFMDKIDVPMIAFLSHTPSGDDRMGLSAVEILKAKRNLMGVANRTPLTRSVGLSQLSGAEVYLKWENLQKTGAYKFRGAYNRVCSLTTDERKRGVITASSGNHALAVSLASQLLGVKATVVVPVSAPKVKIERCRALGANLVITGANFDESLVHCNELAARTGAIYVPGTEDYRVMAGQGTIACEILEEIPDIDAIITPVGGGGLIIGTGFWAKTINKEIRILGAQSTAARAMYESFKAGKVVEIPVVPTIADGLAGQISQMAFELASVHTDDILLAEEKELTNAILWILKNERQVIEGSAAVGPALILQKKIKLKKEEKVAVVVSGGNVDLDTLGLV